MTTRLIASLFCFGLAASAATRSDMLVSTAWLNDHLKDPNVVIVHIGANRTGYDAGHIPGARFLGLPEIAINKNGIPNEMPPVADLKAVFERLGVSDNSRVIIYTEGAPIPAARAYFTLDYLGHDATALLDGGLDQWKAQSRKLETAAPTVAAGHFTPKPRPELIASTDNVKSYSQAASSNAKMPTLLDARPATDYTGSEKAGHIPGALNLNWQSAVVSPSNSTLLPETELRKLAEAAGIKQDKPVVTYCNSGMQASESYFTLKYLGYDVKMYDGSLSEWNKTPGTTLAK